MPNYPENNKNRRRIIKINHARALPEEIPDIEKRRQRELESRLTIAEMDRTCPRLDLHGKNISQSEALVGSFLAQHREEEYVRIVVGTGTGTLEKAMRDYLQIMLTKSVIDGFQRDLQSPEFIVLLKKEN